MAATQWFAITGPHAFCEGCKWTLHGDTIGPRQLASAARFHARDAGHRVRIERGQARYIEPRTEGARLSGGEA